jgi:hypothetical protein
MIILAGCELPARAAGSCIHPWAKPGRYTIEGQLNDRVQRTTAYLTNACRVNFSLPGVFSGAPVQQSGECLAFAFKVRNRPEVFVARWCDDHATVPWNGRDVMVKVSPAGLGQ